MQENLKPGAATSAGTHPHAVFFQDWSRFITFRPELYYRPQDWDDLRAFLGNILSGAFRPRTLRVLGSLHSCSDICVADAIIDVSELPKTIEFNADNTRVIASANWSLHDLLLALSARGKSLSATGGTDPQTLAGVISTNTAPASPGHTLYELLDWVEYLTIDEDGQTVVERRATRGDAAFPAVIGSLGAIGILTKVQFRLLDELFFETIQKVVKLKEVLADVGQTSRQYDFWRIDWLPDTDVGLLWAATRIAHADPEGDYPVQQSENLLKILFEALGRIESAGALLDNPMRLVYSGLALTYGVIKASGPLRNMLPVDRRTPLHVAMAEWSFDPADLVRLMACCREYFERHGWPNLPIEIELTKTDDYFMSAWNWPGLDYIVKFNFMYSTDVGKTEGRRGEVMTHLQGLWEHLIQAGIAFKAHWGKINFMDYDFVRERYALDRFKPFIRPLFLNQYLTERLTPGS